MYLNSAINQRMVGLSKSQPPAGSRRLWPLGDDSHPDLVQVFMPGSGVGGTQLFEAAEFASAQRSQGMRVFSWFQRNTEELHFVCDLLESGRHHYRSFIKRIPAVFPPNSPRFLRLFWAWNLEKRGAGWMGRGSRSKDFVFAMLLLNVWLVG